MGKTAAPKGAVKKAAAKKPAAKKAAVPKSALGKPKKASTKKPATKAKKSTASKKKKAQGSDDENENEGEEPEEEEPDVVAEEEDENGDAQMPDAPKDNEAPAETKAKESKRRNEKARTRGYRHVATKGGYSADYANSDQSRDVAANIITINETRRAAFWKPQIEGVPAFDNLDEFKERLEVANEPLPPRAAEVYRANVEVFMRKLAGDSLQTAFDSGSKKLKPEHVVAHTRKLQKHLKYTVTAPHGVIRYAQLQKDGERLRIPTSDQEALATEDPQLTEDQKAAVLEQEAANQARGREKEARVAKAKAKKASRAA